MKEFAEFLAQVGAVRHAYSSLLANDPLMGL